MTTENIDSNNIPQWLKDHKRQVMALYDNVKAIDPETVDLSEVCEILVSLSLIKADIAYIFEEMSEKTQKAMAQQEMVDIDSGYVIERRWSKPRKSWRHEELADIVAERINRSAINLDTGEVTMSTKEMIVEMMKYVQPSYWRVGALSSIGILADEYCETGEPVEKINIRKK